MLTLDKIYHAAFILKEVARKTDLIHATNIPCEADLYLKTENLQVTGSFKLRGAYYKISQLSEEQTPGTFSLEDACAWAAASGGFACFCMGGTYLEKTAGEKRAKLQRYHDAYFTQLNGK